MLHFVQVQFDPDSMIIFYDKEILNKWFIQLNSNNNYSWNIITKYTFKNCNNTESYKKKTKKLKEQITSITKRYVVMIMQLICQYLLQTTC